MPKTQEKATILSDGTRCQCESCGKRADIKLKDGSTWCWPCDQAARRMGY